MINRTMKTIDLVYFNAGGGHRAAARALESVIREQGRPWTVRCVNLVDVIDPKGLFRRHVGCEPEAYYNQRLARGWTLGLSQELKVLQGMIRLYHRTLVRRLQAHWAATEPDLVVSLVPNFNRAMAEAVASALPGVRFMTVMTDMADLPPHFWVETDRPQWLICGTGRAMAQARRLGVPEDRLSRVSGMILRPDFYRPATVSRADALASLGLSPDEPVGIVMFGGHGSNEMAGIARVLRDRQLILMCGHNVALARRLVGKTCPRGRAAQAVVGFTPDVVDYLRLGDYFIGKPGPGSLSEALRLGLPVVTFDNAWTMPQERYNAQWVREHGLGLVVRSRRELAGATHKLLNHLDAFKARVQAVDNRAVFEVVDLMAAQLARSEHVDEPCPLCQPSPHSRF